MVVNCFQNCIFTPDSHHTVIVFKEENGCELLSKLYFYTWFTSKVRAIHQEVMLWIAFKIVFLHLIHILHLAKNKWRQVVNCFQNCIFTPDSHPNASFQSLLFCCELLSKLYFYTWFTSLVSLILLTAALWIAFKIVFLHLIHISVILQLNNQLLWIAFKIVFLHLIHIQ